jgi:prevent-host-death family protein
MTTAAAVSSREARERFADLVSSAAYRKERFVVTRYNREMVALVPVEDLERLELLEDYVDLQAAREALQEAREEGTLSWDDVKAELGL